MHDSPGSVVTQLCSGLQLYSAERRIADCILADVKWASVATSAELAKASHSSEATVTRLCHKLGYANYRKFQLELARDVLEQQETEARKRPPNDPLHQALLDLQNNRQEEVQATIQALNLVQLRKVLSILRAAEIIEIEANGSSLPVAMDASLKLGSLGKRCMISPVPEKARSFSSALTPKDALLLISSAGRCEALETAARAAKKNGTPVILITCDKRFGAGRPRQLYPAGLQPHPAHCQRYAAFPAFGSAGGGGALLPAGGQFRSEPSAMMQKVPTILAGTFCCD